MIAKNLIVNGSSRFIGDAYGNLVGTINGHTVEKDVPSNALFTDTTYSVVAAGTSTTAGGLMSQADKTKLNGIATGAEVNQNAFSNVTVGNTTIAADSKTDTLTFAAGSNVTITPDATNDKITIAATDTTYSVVSAGTSTTAGGLMSQADKTKLNGISASAEVNQNAFSNVVVGSTTIAADTKTDSLTLAAGNNITLTPDATNDKVTIAATDTTYGVVSKTANGLAPQLPNETTTTKYLRQDGSWQIPPNDNTHNTAYLYAGASNGSANAATTNGNTYLIIKDGSSVSTRNKITGTGATSVSSDANGVITINSTNTWNAMTGATSSADGTVGYVNAVPPKANYNTAYLRADGTWQVPPNTGDTHHTAYLYAGAASGTANAATTNGNTYLLLVENSTFRSGVKLVPGSNMNITSDASGNVTFTATDTTYSVVSAGTSTTAGGLMSQADKTKLNGIATGAEVNQNAFSNFTIGSTTIEADSKTDTLTFVAGSNISLTPDATNDKITIAATDTTYSVVSAGTSTTDGGLMSQADKTKLDGIATGAEVNQNAFSNITVGSTTIQADGKTDTLTLVASSNITLTPDATNDKVTIAATNTIPSAYCTTAAGTAAKVASCTGYTLRQYNYIQVIITNANSYNGAITLNINNTGAKTISINGQTSSSSNKTLPAGSYIVYYDGSKYHFNTDKSIPGYVNGAQKVSTSGTSSKRYLIGGNAKGTTLQELNTSTNEIYMEGETLCSPIVKATKRLSVNNATIDEDNDEVTISAVEDAYLTYGRIILREQDYEEDSSTGEMSVSSSTDVIKLDANLKTITVNSQFADRYSELSGGSVYFRDGTSRAILYGDSLMFTQFDSNNNQTDTIILNGVTGSGTFMDDIQIEKETLGNMSANFIAKSSSNLAEIRLSVSGVGNHGLYSTGYYNGSSFVSDAKWIIYRNNSGDICTQGTLNIIDGNLWANKSSGEVDNGVYHSGNGLRTYLAITNGGSTGLYSNGYYNGSAFVQDTGKWLICRDTSNQTIINGPTTHNGHFNVQNGHISSRHATDAHTYALNTTTNCYSSARSLNNGQHGLYSSGYWNGSSFVSSSGVWMMYRDTEGLVRTRSCSGTDSTPLVNTSMTQGKRLSGANCNTSTQLALYGQWGTSGTTYAWRYVTVSTSDPRLKENIEPTKMNALELINKINLYSFDWKNDDTPHYDVGYLATELYELDHNLAIKPDDESEGYWGVNDFYMSGVQTKAIQELSKENEELRRKIQSLERRISLVENAKNDVTH